MFEIRITAIIIAAAVLLGFTFNRGYVSGKNQVQQLWDAEAKKQAVALANTEKLYRKKEQDWLDAAEKARKERQREITSINSKHNALVDSLRERPERHTSAGTQVSETPAACTGVSGAELARGDGEFLAGYAADAAKLKSALKQCEIEYNKLRQEE